MALFPPFPTGLADAVGSALGGAWLPSLWALAGAALLAVGLGAWLARGGPGDGRRSRRARGRELRRRVAVAASIALVLASPGQPLLPALVWVIGLLGVALAGSLIVGLVSPWRGKWWRSREAGVDEAAHRWHWAISAVAVILVLLMLGGTDSLGPPARQSIAGAMAANQTGEVWAWGDNRYGQTGATSTNTCVSYVLDFSHFEG